MTKLGFVLGLTLFRIPKTGFGKALMGTGEDMHGFETLAEQRLGIKVSLCELDVIGYP